MKHATKVRNYIQTTKNQYYKKVNFLLVYFIHLFLYYQSDT